jgi:uncharacterized damage-inducible protein DinB
MEPPKTEAWLRGPIEGVSTYIAPTLFSFQQAREDVEKFTAGLSNDQIWVRIEDLAPVGFHIRHIGGSADRLITYIEGKQLSETQLAALKTEMDPGESREQLLAGLDAALTRAEKFCRGLDVAQLEAPRSVGRKQLPTTVIGLLIHLAEHTQRHTGQCVTTAKIIRCLNLPESAPVSGA